MCRGSNPVQASCTLQEPIEGGFKPKDQRIPANKPVLPVIQVKASLQVNHPRVIETTINLKKHRTDEPPETADVFTWKGSLPF